MGLAIHAMFGLFCLSAAVTNAEAIIDTKATYNAMQEYRAALASASYPAVEGMTYTESVANTTYTPLPHRVAGQCPTQGYPTGKTTTQSITGFDQSGKNRKFHVLVPANYNNSAPVPLHIALSGLNAPCLNVFNGWKKTAEARGYVLVSPCASIGDGAISMGIGWNSGTCCGFAKDSPTDDFALMRAVVKDVTEKLCIDPAHVWVSGFSNGAMMAEVLACRQPDIFSAAASVSGVVELRPGGKKGLTACDDAVKNFSKRASVINVHGDLDPMVPWQSDPVIGFPSIPNDFAAWGARTGCAVGPKDNWVKGKYNSTVFEQCTDGRAVEVVKNHGGSHEWPSDSDFDTTSYVQAFFDRAG